MHLNGFLTTISFNKKICITYINLKIYISTFSITNITFLLNNNKKTCALLLKLKQEVFFIWLAFFDKIFKISLKKQKILINFKHFVRTSSKNKTNLFRLL